LRAGDARPYNRVQVLPDVAVGAAIGRPFAGGAVLRRNMGTKKEKPDGLLLLILLES